MSGPLISTMTAGSGPGIVMREGANVPTIAFDSMASAPMSEIVGGPNLLRLMPLSANGFLVLGGAGVERARITPAGRFLVGKTASNFATSGCEVAGDIPCMRVTTNLTDTALLELNQLTGATTIYALYRYNGTGIGSVRRNGTNNGVNFNETSDERQKDLLGPVDDERAEWIAQITEPVMYAWKTHPDAPRMGYIAQHVARQWPESVDIGLVTPGEGDETWEMNHTRLIPVLHAAWASTQRKLAALTARVEALEAR